MVTPGYAPFEQYDAGNEQRQGPWSDIYGLAATLYHAITGGPPTDALTRGMCLLNGDPDPLVPATACAPGRFSARLLGAVDRGLAFKACDRPQTVEEWRELFPLHTGVRPVRQHVRTEALAGRGVVPGLGTILVGDDAPSAGYVAKKHETCAAVGIRSPVITLNKVVLPAPLGPMMAKVSASGTWRLTPCSTFRVP